MYRGFQSCVPDQLTKRVRKSADRDDEIQERFFLTSSWALGEPDSSPSEFVVCRLCQPDSWNYEKQNVWASVATPSASCLLLAPTMEFQTFLCASELPSYSPSVPVPSYSFELACGEQRLEHTPRVVHPPPTSVFVKKIGRTTVVLNEQEEGVSVPTFGRSAHISGTVCFEESCSVLGVVLQVEGKLDSTISEAGGLSTKLFNQRYPLWSQCNSQGEPCPSQIPFSVFLPPTFTYNGAAAPLPPSFHTHFMDVPALFVKASYQLRFIITRIRHKKLEMWPKVKHAVVPFTYVPRTRSHRPIVTSPCFFSSVKTSPEEWYQAVTSLRTRPNARIDPITCHLFIPAGRIYGLKDKIPFHVQLSGIICTLKDVFAGCVSGLDRVLSVDSSNTTASRRSPAENPFIRVYLLRQVSVSMKGTSAWRNIVLGEGTLAPIPPDLSSCCSLTRQCREGHVDWEGEVSCRDDITVGGFNAANVHVKDFIALSLTPPDRRSSPLLDLQVTIPIRLVTDSWTDVAGPDAGALAQ
ncbi:unnamed protein product [Cyclocybe aegerita]|uniref:Uncharacterized protein n=1 Tax=Cyclocybe aegerita TaxID=1973307 RepID=A0A8S0WIC1_CYCAE|nr:unnamed protein product [Cyclocybe aegerita]